MTLAQAALTFVSLLVIVDPLALAPVFAALTRGMDAAGTRRAAAVATAAGMGLLAAAGLGGHAALRVFDVEKALIHLTVAALLLVMGAVMLLGRGDLGRFGGARRDPALFPLAFPLIAGPGGMGAMAMFAGRDAGEPGALATLYALLALVGALTYAALRAAEPISRRLGPNGVRLVTRILGAVLVAAAAKFLYDGLRDYGLLGGQAAA